MYIIKIKMINLKKPKIIITHLNAGAQKKIVFGPVKTKCNNYAKSFLMRIRTEKISYNQKKKYLSYPPDVPKVASSPAVQLCRLLKLRLCRRQT